MWFWCKFSVLKLREFLYSRQEKGKEGRLLIFNCSLVNWDLCPCRFLNENRRVLPLVGVAWTKSGLEVPGSVFHKAVLEVTQPSRVTPFNSWGLSLFLSCGSAPKFKGSFRTVRVTGWCPGECADSCWGCWEAGQEMRFRRFYSWQSYQSDSAWWAKTCEWDWRRIYCLPALDGLEGCSPVCGLFATSVMLPMHHSTNCFSL